MKGDRRPGTVDLRRVGASKAGKSKGSQASAAPSGQPLVVANLFGQDAPGKPKGSESAEVREQFFQTGLKELEAKLLDLPEVKL